MFAAARVHLVQRHAREVIGQLLKQERLLLLCEWIRRARILDREQLDLRRHLQPRQSLLVDPLRRREIQDSAYDGERRIQSLSLDAFRSALRNEALQCAHVHLSKIEIPDHRIEHLQLHSIVADAFLLGVVLQIFRRSGPERAARAKAVKHRLANLIHPLGEMLLRLREATCSSAFANADSSVLLVDVPDPTAIRET